MLQVLLTPSLRRGGRLACLAKNLRCRIQTRPVLGRGGFERVGEFGRGEERTERRGSVRPR